MQTLSDFDREFGTDEQCRAFLAKMRWRDGVRCPRCKASEKVYALAARPYHWVCKSGAETVDKQTGEVMVCHKRNGYRFSVTSKTIFEDTKIALNLWFKVGYLMLTSKEGNQRASNPSRDLRREIHPRLSHKLVSSACAGARRWLAICTSR